MPGTTLVCVMYHYVRPRDPIAWGGIHPLAPDEFASQLDALTQLGEIVHPHEAGRSGRPVEVVLTFDDGTRDHYEYVFPELKSRGLAGLFAVMSGPASGQVPLVSLVHVLTSRLTDAEFLAELRDRVHFPPPDVKEMERLYWRETSPERREVKHLLNFALPHETALGVATELYEARVGSLDDLIDDWYLSDGMVREMSAEGMGFAAHCHRHIPLFGPVSEYCRQEILPCRDWLTRLLGRPPVDYAAPFGGQASGGPGLRELQPWLASHGFRSCYTVERGINPDYTGDTYLLKRLDAADLPPRGPMPPELDALA